MKALLILVFPIFAVAVYAVSLEQTYQNIQKVLYSRTYFYAGGAYVPASDGSSIFAEQIYVEHLAPSKVSAKHPIVMIHGNGMTGTNFLNTPDGRPGWADYFLSQGYEVYIIDQASRARSPWQQNIDGPQTAFSTLYIEQHFTATQRFNLWPQAHLHTQWPGNGSQGDPTFDSFYASIMPSLSSSPESAQKTRDGVAALLDKIGPAVVLTHSQSGSHGWVIADVRPSLVKAIIAIEPFGPPFVAAVFPPFTTARPYGVTEIPVEFTPPIESPSDLHPVTISSSANFTCMEQASPARKLTNLQRIPVLVVTSQSGYHAVYDSCTVNFLQQAGVSVKHVSLPDVGIFGNGHMMFMEKNNLQIVAEVLDTWLSSEM
ncbi:alpha/beta-hydrolase [Pholiota conissans]|uniref:Alpha/beta-hydrolase n=1 Tax=Pholiota conissans TaxID=109636 RepID=A0A9P6CSY6_9AGAR|nr:alpha/beta-hydrolase [Pholiota conissans]